ncbi:MAG: CoA transferase [Rhodospirillaceae bacterium]|nr:CoA transferase [Rhodospirillaceae bacterium]
MKALSDIVMLDLTHMLSGPFAAMLLADLGAQTIKIEPPGSGEMTRGLLADDPRYAYKGMGPYFRTLNRNKKSVCIDLKRDEGRALFHQLATEADIVVNNFRPGVPERLGIDHATLAALNPRIVTCSVTGFGEEGPDCDRTAFDVVAQGYGGGMSITGEAGGPPIRAGVPMGDLSSGLFGAIAMLAALHAREATGRGQHIDLSMQDCQVSLLSYIAAMHLLSGEVPRQFGNAHPIYVPYNAFPTGDRWLIIAVVKDDQWARLRDVLGNPALMDARFDGYEGRRDHREEVDGGITAALAARGCDAWLATLRAARVPCGPVNDVGHALADVQVQARDMVVEIGHPDGGSFRTTGNPIKLSETPCDSYDPPPLLGQHTDEVLSGLCGKSAADLARLREAGVIA